MARAANSLPVPVSPWINSDTSQRDTLSMSSTTRVNAGDLPTNTGSFADALAITAGERELFNVRLLMREELLQRRGEWRSRSGLRSRADQLASPDLEKTSAK